ncbi:MAG TPA: DUF3500 domain-containing protein [Puia sp.]|nr:DUF3500 domain-containing protein [Puia sp.]
MNKIGSSLIFFGLFFLSSVKAQELVPAAAKFISMLDSNQQVRALYPFDTDERFTYHYFPVNNRKGIAMDELNDLQKQAALDLIKTCLSEQTIKKMYRIIQLEVILKALEKRKPDDHYRDPGKYYFTLFGVPAINSIWGWRLEGHHVYFSFSANNKILVSGTPGFLGANPAVVQEGSQKGQEVLMEEREMGFALLNKLSSEELKKAIIDSIVPGDIMTATNRKAMILHPTGLPYSEMTGSQQGQLLELIRLYVYRFTKLFADTMLKEIQEAGLNNLSFAWAGNREPGIGRPHYYRIQGPTIIIEYDNTQNNANHVHTVVRDLKHDFGGDLLLEHYRSGH